MTDVKQMLISHFVILITLVAIHCFFADRKQCGRGLLPIQNSAPATRRQTVNVGASRIVVGKLLSEFAS